jgi:dTDP-glucose pyrophosphorylase/CBS-domain-containing membrane protein
MEWNTGDPVDDILIAPHASITEALARLEEAGTGALPLCTSGRKLVGLLTDGDVRRAVLRGVSLEDPCGTIANANPVTSGAISSGEALYLMTRHDINHLPVVDESGVLINFLRRKDLVSEGDIAESANRRLASLVIDPDASITEAIAHLDKAGTGALALCKPSGKLVGLLTDGDIRRAILRGISLDGPCEAIAVPNPITAPESISRRSALALMTRHDVDHLPLIDVQRHLVQFLLRRELVVEAQPDLSAVIMAGGYGKRLLPLTEGIPKPMLPVGDRPLLERTIQQLRRSGIRDVSLTTHHLSESIRHHFGDGEAFGVSISYADEDQPLGTAGGLNLVKRPSGPFLVINGDILTYVPFNEMLSFHQKYHADMTVGVRKYEVQVPFGVVECDDVRITRLREKPSLVFFINAGIYLLEPAARDRIPKDVRFDMTDLIKALLDDGRTVVGFPIVEYWRDVGQHEEYRQAQKDVQGLGIRKSAGL